MEAGTALNQESVIQHSCSINLYDINLITYLAPGFHIQKIKNIKTHVLKGPFKLRIPGFLEISFQSFNKRYLYFLKCFTKNVMLKKENLIFIQTVIKCDNVRKLVGNKTRCMVTYYTQ